MTEEDEEISDSDESLAAVAADTASGDSKAGRGKCIKQPAVIAERNAKSHSNQHQENQYIAGNALLIIGDFEHLFEV